jgi:hypothetical protein
MRLLREHFPRLIENDVVLIGTDAGSERVFPEPIALWHKYFGRTYAALASARPRVVAVDFGLPERSFDSLMKEGIDAEIMKGLVLMRRSGTDILFVQHVSDASELVPIQENFRGLVPDKDLGVDRQLRDPDGVSRRFSDTLLLDESGKPLPTLAGRIGTNPGTSSD